MSSLGSGVLTPRGQIKIEKTFQLKSYPNIYAIGDVIDWVEQKQAAKAPKHAQIAAANILAQLNGGVPKKSYSGQPELIIITNGKVGGSSLSIPPTVSDIVSPLAEAGHFFPRHALGHHARQLVLELDEGQRIDGWHGAEGLWSCSVTSHHYDWPVVRF